MSYDGPQGVQSIDADELLPSHSELPKLQRLFRLLHTCPQHERLARLPALPLWSHRSLLRRLRLICTIVGSNSSAEPIHWPSTAAAPINGAEPGARVRTTLAPQILFSGPVPGEPVSAHVASYPHGDEERSNRCREQEAALVQRLAQMEPDPSRYLYGRTYAMRSSFVLAQEIHAIEEKEGGIASATRSLYSSTRLKHAIDQKRDSPSFPNVRSSEASAAATVAFAVPHIRKSILA